MIWMNYVFAGGEYSLDSTPHFSSSFNNVSIGAGAWDELYLTKDDNQGNAESIPDAWDYNTCLHATFDGDLKAGNVSFYATEVTSMLIKRREVGTLNWVTLANLAVNDADDLSFEYFDTTTQSNKKYEYAIVPIIGTVEGSASTAMVDSSFNGLFIVAGDQVVGTQLDVVITQQRNRQASVVPTLNRKYPFVVSNAALDYDSGSVAAVWLAYDKANDTWDIQHGAKYRSSIEDLLNSGAPMLLKYEDGRMWLISVSGSAITNAPEGTSQKITTTFEWTEIGDANSEDDLRANGFID